MELTDFFPLALLSKPRLPHEEVAASVTTIELPEIQEGVTTTSTNDLWKRRFFDSRDSDEGVRTSSKADFTSEVNRAALQGGRKTKQEKDKSHEEEGLSSIPDLCEVCRKYYLAIPRS